MSSEQSRITVYYNGACPVCDAGIARQRARMADTDNVHWCDINESPDALSERGVEIDDIRLRLYLVDTAGRLHAGVDAFRELWSRTTGQHLLATVMGWPPVRVVACLAYEIFARVLFRWNRLRGRW